MRKRLSAFTLLELIVAISLSFLVLLGLGAVFSGTLTVWTRIQQSGNALSEGRIAMEWLIRDIREKEIVAANPHSIQFTGIEYTLDGATLNRNGDLVAQGVVQLDFNYYDQNNSPPEELADIRFVSIFLKTKNNGKELELRNGAGVRNYESG